MDTEAYLHKSVSLRFMGQETELGLSHGLFSSFDVDSGTRLLLKTLASRPELARLGRAVDIGCGTGVIGIALAKALPQAQILAIDRDALALAVTERNLAHNGLCGRVTTRSGLLMDIGGEWDLIVSNLPAKAGQEALGDFFLRAPHRLTPGGLVCVVIVNTLAPMAERSIRGYGHELLLKEEGPGHSVFAFRASSNSRPEPTQDRLGPYRREAGDYRLQDQDYRLESLRGLADFDTIGYGTKLAAKLLAAELGREGGTPTGPGPTSVLIWGPGQGHLPIYAAKAFMCERLSLASRDLLELEASRGNLSLQCPQLGLECHHVPDPSFLDAQFGAHKMWLLRYEAVPTYDGLGRYLERASANLESGALLLLQGTSSSLSILDKHRPKPWSIRAQKREKGQRALLLTRA